MMVNQVAGKLPPTHLLTSERSRTIFITDPQSTANCQAVKYIASAVYAIVVCLSACLSVTLRYIKTPKQDHASKAAR